jgi:hypothetical protein
MLIMRRCVRALGLVVLLTLTPGVAASSAAQAASMHRVPVLFHVAQGPTGPVAEPTFVKTQLAHANTVFRELGIELVAVEVRQEPQQGARLVSRADRDRLARLLSPGMLNVFVVATLMDVDEPGRERRGVHWRVRRDPSRHFVVVSAISGPYVLAHELGHYFGNPEHSQTPGNLMSYTHTEAVPVLDPEQRERVWVTLRRMLAQGELEPPP